MNRNIIFYDKVDSTNLKLKELAVQGVAEGTVVVAARQTAGRGRQGRSWESSSEDNLYFSLLLRPQFSPNKAAMLTLLMAYSVAKVIRKKLSLPAQIKWPNDIILSKKKCCGILTEMYMENAQIGYVIIGTGLNVNVASFPEELREKATSLFLEQGEHICRETLLKDVLEEFICCYERFLETKELSWCQEKYNAMLVNRGAEVCIHDVSGEYPAIAKGINRWGELIIEKEDGSEQTVYAGEVSVRGIYGYI